MRTGQRAVNGAGSERGAADAYNDEVIELRTDFICERLFGLNRMGRQVEEEARLTSAFSLDLGEHFFKLRNECFEVFDFDANAFTARRAEGIRYVIRQKVHPGMSPVVLGSRFSTEAKRSGGVIRLGLFSPSSPS